MPKESLHEKFCTDCNPASHHEMTALQSTASKYTQSLELVSDLVKKFRNWSAKFVFLEKVLT